MLRFHKLLKCQLFGYDGTNANRIPALLRLLFAPSAIAAGGAASK
jgi:hypothetical protein